MQSSEQPSDKFNTLRALTTGSDYKRLKIPSYIIAQQTLGKPATFITMANDVTLYNELSVVRN